MRITMQQIADHLGLSKYAVSRSLSGKDGVSEETRAQVEQAARTLGYIKPAGPALRDIALVFHDIDVINSELRMMIQNGVQREAERLQFPVRMQWTHLPEHVAKIAQTSAGILLVGPHDRKTIAIANAAGVPVVRLGWVAPLEQADQVSGTDHEAGGAVGSYLIGHGHRTIAFVHGTAGYRGRLERFYGLREVAEQHGDVQLHEMSFDENSGFLPALKRLQKNGTHPTAFFCAHDGLAVTVVSALLAQGYRIPEDVSVVGFGDFASATQISPPLTTVRVQGADMGAAALRLLAERIETPPASRLPARRVLIASTFVERSSSGPCRVP
jgi:LacI family transcriptional regulator